MPVGFDFEDFDEKEEKITKFILQEIKDLLEGRIRSANIVEYRNTMVFNDWGNCDATYPFIMDFELLENMTKLVECKVTFKIRNFNIGVKNI
ncbi:MAG TPA: hypothetical protein ENG48_08670 [Candidatus Atribacteria bacterium]|nr:hypothetical protein [Candidatus Atribacteria bacterium]